MGKQRIQTKKRKQEKKKHIKWKERKEETRRDEKECMVRNRTNQRPTRVAHLPAVDDVVTGAAQQIKKKRDSVATAHPKIAQ